MGIVCDYFVAKDDDEAARTAAWSGGPSRPSASRSGFFRRRDAAPLPAGLPTVELPGLEPVVMLATLEELLTGAPADEVLDANAGDLGAEGKEGLVFRLRPELTDVLAAAAPERLAAVAEPWSRTDEMGGADPADLVDALRRLSALARTAHRSGGRVHCWTAR